MNPRSTDCEADALTTTPSRRLLTNEQFQRNANDDQNACHDENDIEDAPSTSHSITSECPSDDETDSDIDGDNHEAAAPSICDVETLLDNLAACNITKSSDHALLKRCKMRCSHLIIRCRRCFEANGNKRKHCKNSNCLKKFKKSVNYGQSINQLFYFSLISIHRK